MNSFRLLVAGLLISVALSATTCSSECPRGNLRLDGGSRNWLPLKGKTQLTFVDQFGTITNYTIHVVDTLQPYIKQPECSGNYSYEYINVDLYLNTTKTDSIHCAMISGSRLSLSAYSDKKPSMTYGNLLSQPGSTSLKTRFSTFSLGSRTYSDVLLATSMFANGGIDSVYLAYNYGLIGFTYHNQKYVLK